MYIYIYISDWTYIYMDSEAYLDDTDTDYTKHSGYLRLRLSKTFQILPWYSSTPYRTTVDEECYGRCPLPTYILPIYKLV